jgi:NAD(P)-dependent dehydrogenase (short-subunit alcohol dehydrogenase family)
MTNSTRVALVTGAARGIGRAIALQLARNGKRIGAPTSVDRGDLGVSVSDLTLPVINVARLILFLSNHRLEDQCCAAIALVRVERRSNVTNSCFH